MSLTGKLYWKSYISEHEKLVYVAFFEIFLQVNLLAIIKLLTLLSSIMRVLEITSLDIFLNLKDTELSSANIVNEKKCEL